MLQTMWSFTSYSPHSKSDRNLTIFVKVHFENKRLPFGSPLLLSLTIQMSWTEPYLEKQSRNSSSVALFPPRINNLLWSWAILSDWSRTGESARPLYLSAIVGDYKFCKNKSWKFYLLMDKDVTSFTDMIVFVATVQPWAQYNTHVWRSFQIRDQLSDNQLKTLHSQCSTGFIQV